MEPLEYRNIVTPAWKPSELAEPVPAPVVPVQVDEDLSDGAYLRRHAAPELDERRKFLLCFSAGQRRRNNSNAGGPGANPLASPAMATLHEPALLNDEASQSAEPTADDVTSEHAPAAALNGLAPLASPTTDAAKRPKIVIDEADMTVMYQKIYQWRPNPDATAGYLRRVFPITEAEYRSLQREDVLAVAEALQEREAARLTFSQTHGTD